LPTNEKQQPEEVEQLEHQRGPNVFENLPNSNRKMKKPSRTKGITFIGCEKGGGGGNLASAEMQWVHKFRLQMYQCRELVQKRSELVFTDKNIL
jgi:hypothetical protein